MATATKTRKAPTKAKATAKAEIDWRATLIEALNAPGALGNTYNRFYNYSFLNQIRLFMQGVNEPVATYRRWSELGYQVQKGQKAHMVLAPIIITKRDETGKPKLNSLGKAQTVLVGFRESRTVFGFSQTDGEELPEIEVPAWDMKLALKALGVSRKRFKMSDGNTQGYSYEDEKDGKVIAINPAAKYPAKTTFHELAHLALGHCKALADGAPDVHRGAMEFEAEATAYLVAKELELVDWAPAESRAYIDGWIGADMVWNDETGESDIVDFDKHAGRIFAAANKILTAGRPAKSE